MDIPKLNTIILGSPKSDIIQSVGRILRQKKEDRKVTPKIIDISNNISLFHKQGKKREAYYKKCKYTINKIDMNGNIVEVEYKKGKGKGGGKGKVEEIDYSKSDVCYIDF